MNLFINHLFTDPVYFFSWVLVIAFSVCLHEYAHARLALRCGDDTAARAGHLTLNPMVQMGPTSLVMLALLGLAWGAVPIHPGRLSRRAGALVAFAGPAANLLLCLVTAGIFAAVLTLRPESAASPTARFFHLAALANGVLFVFNMLPVPIFDGWAVFSLFFPALGELSAQRANQISSVVLLVLFITPAFAPIWAAGAWLAERALGSWAQFFSLFLPA